MRTFFLITALAFTASAQTPAPEPACGPCAAGAACVGGVCQFSCVQDSECRKENVCVEGHCEARLPLQRPGDPAVIRRADATHAERFKVTKPIPPGFHLAQEPSGEAIARGSIAFATAWLPAAIAALISRAPVLAIPVAGPVLAYRPEVGPMADLHNFGTVSAIAIDVSVQLFGLVMVVAGLAVPSKWLERDLSIAIVPAVTGAHLVGRF